MRTDKITLYLCIEGPQNIYTTEAPHDSIKLKSSFCTEGNPGVKYYFLSFIVNA